MSTWNTRGMRFASLQPGDLTLGHSAAIPMLASSKMAQEMCQELHPHAASVTVNTVVFSGAGDFFLFFCGVSDQVLTY